MPSHHVDVLDKGDKKFSQFKHSIIVSCYSHLALVCQFNRPFATVGHVTCFSRTH